MRLLVRVDSFFFILLLGKKCQKQMVSGCNSIKNKIKNHWDFRLLFPPTTFWKIFKKLPTYFTPLCNLKRENGKYGKLKKIDWNDI